MTEAAKTEWLMGELERLGFEIFVSVRVGASLRKIATIKAVRELTRMGLREAKDAVEQQQIILPAVSLEEGERAVAVLERGGGRGLVAMARASRHAFVPDHERRGSQVCERLSVIGWEVVLERGRLGEWGDLEVLLDAGDGKNPRAVLGAIGDQRRRWADAGLAEAGSEIELLERVSDREGQLEARIRAAADEELPREAAVYADWLQARGDPRGQVGAAALARDAATDERQRDALSRSLSELLEIHAPHLLGPIHGLIDPSGFRWVGPVIIEARLEGQVDVPSDLDPMATFFELPTLACLRHLELRGSFAEDRALGELLAGSTCASSLEQLSVSGPRNPGLRLHGRLERLDTMSLELGVLRFEEFSAPALRELSVDLRYPPEDLRASLAGLDAPRLEHFAFGTEIYDFWDQRHGPFHRHLRSSLALPVFAALRRLTLRSLGDSLPLQLGLAQVLLEHLPKSVERVDLSAARIVPRARERLADAPSGAPEFLLPPLGAIG